MFPQRVTLALLAQALPIFAAVHEKLVTLPFGWQAVSAPADTTTLTFSIGLQQQNIDQLESTLLAVSTPGNAKYGQHLDVDDVNALFAPSTAAVSAVQSWLSASSIDSELSTDGQWLTFSTTVGTANTLLDAEFLQYENSGETKIRTTQYSVPNEVSSYIDLVIPTTFFGKTTANAPVAMKSERALTAMSKRVSNSSIDASCQTLITPVCLKELYGPGLLEYVPDVSSGSRVGFGSFLNQSASYSDLQDFEAYFNITSQNFTSVLIQGGVDDQDPATAGIGESNLDVQNIVGIAHPLPVTQFITGGSPPFIPDADTPTNTNEPYIPYYQYLLSQPNSALPQVISNSYGDTEQTVPYKYAVRACNMIGFMGLRGITVLESSGDIGVGAACIKNDGSNSSTFTPTFPGTCPYVLSIGGTQAVTPEIAWVASSGGFSDYFPRSLWQEGAISTYLDKYISPAVKTYYEPYTNFSGRGFPDISAHSLTPWYAGFYDGELEQNGGTSAAAPTVAGILALLNDARFKAGKSSLGFINPLLYLIGASSLNDITGGGSVGCNGINGQTGQPTGGAVIPYATWNSTIGWDPVTGLGTPNFAKLKSLVLSLY